MARTAISLFIDDTHFEPAGAFAPLVDFCLEQGLRGKVSLIPALSARDGRRPPLGDGALTEEAAFLAQLRRIAAGGFDVHMELMTHDKLWDFGAGRMRPDGPCEGIWLYDPAVPVAEYEAYLGGILEQGRKAGLTINGLSVPGCGCDGCLARWDALQAAGHTNVSDHAFQALLNLARQGRFGVPVVAVYSDEADEAHPTRLIRAEGGFGVYDCRLDMSVQDQIGFAGSNADFYITEDGSAGRIVDLVRQGAAQCFFCAHWYDMNPRQAEGWHTFQAIIRRINRHLGDRITWVKPSDYGAGLLAAGGADVSQG